MGRIYEKRLIHFDWADGTRSFVIRRRLQLECSNCVASNTRRLDVCLSVWFTRCSGNRLNAILYCHSSIYPAERSNGFNWSITAGGKFIRKLNAMHSAARVWLLERYIRFGWSGAELRFYWSISSNYSLRMKIKINCAFDDNWIIVLRASVLREWTGSFDYEYQADISCVSGQFKPKNTNYTKWIRTDLRTDKRRWICIETGARDIWKFPCVQRLNLYAVIQV